jgi:hypothetical protein
VPAGAAIWYYYGVLVYHSVLSLVGSGDKLKIALFGQLSVWKRLWTCRETDKYLNLRVLWVRRVASQEEVACRTELWVQSDRRRPPRHLLQRTSGKWRFTAANESTSVCRWIIWWRHNGRRQINIFSCSRWFISVFVSGDVAAVNRFGCFSFIWTVHYVIALERFVICGFLQWWRFIL